jgi:fructoselysine-6-P-deglycase FrlB-like protein
MSFDPLAPLPGAPDPWTGSALPPLRERPPYLMTEMIAAEPALAERIVARVAEQPATATLAERLRAAATAGEPILTTGCGTSEHAAMAISAMLEDALGPDGPRIGAVQAFELARRPPRSGVLLAVSHEGGTDATNAALAAAAAAGATTALVTVSDRSPGAALAEWVLTTREQDQSWCHTVGYLSPMVAGAALAGRLRRTPLDGIAVRALLDAADHAPAADASAAALVGCERLLIAGSGIDYVSARELALKVEEGARMPAVAHQLETVRHGHLAAADERTGFVLILTDGEGRGTAVVERARAVLRSAAALALPATALVAADLGDDLPRALTPAGRAAVPLATRLPRIVCAGLATAIPLQLLAERLARARGMNPDTIGRDDPRQAAAAEA